jgi:hypothetical protein
VRAIPEYAVVGLSASVRWRTAKSLVNDKPERVCPLNPLGDPTIDRLEGDPLEDNRPER